MFPPMPSQEDPEPVMQMFSHLPPLPSPTITSGSLSVDNVVHDFASSYGSSDYMELPTFSSSSYKNSDYMELPTFGMYDDNSNVQPSSSTGTPSYSLRPYLTDAPPSSPISSWNHLEAQNYSSPPRFRPRDTFESFQWQTAAPDVTQPSLQPFITSESPKFNFPPISAPVSSFLDVPQHVTELLGTESVMNETAAAESVATIVVNVVVPHVVVPPAVGPTIVADPVATPQMDPPAIVANIVAPQTVAADMAVLPVVRKTGRVCTETTRLMQADNIGQNMKQTRPAAGSSGPTKKRQK
ncbi:hypothetical protein DFJ58DRAFT_720872 [Suillus subalutaceus]|uniref:uncharacterized protein n=1 Tax=Suillus subalutaceus TaxID=48586 RepID=UPI001B8833D6|nr:uncharacterized protein DFJ58DRAFT_720872 [Suillus subalutaceus]KAG1878128.1 hypothetical protein DFJ58DRAFT_720872 [Suillus subalutaceus]